MLTKHSKQQESNSWSAEWLHAIAIIGTVCTVLAGIFMFKHFYITPEKDLTDRMQCQMSLSKKLTCKGTLRQVFLSV
jgi:hypothetical protein